MSGEPAATADLQARLRKSRLLVVGDAMLDRYLFGEVERISPEAPVPVVRVTREEHRLGGAANVALNVKALGPAVTLITVVGEDEPARTLEGLLKIAGGGGDSGQGPTALHLCEAAGDRPGAAAGAGGLRESARP